MTKYSQFVDYLLLLYTAVENIASVEVDEKMIALQP